MWRELGESTIPPSNEDQPDSLLMLWVVVCSAAVLFISAVWPSRGSLSVSKCFLKSYIILSSYHVVLAINTFSFLFDDVCIWLDVAFMALFSLIRSDIWPILTDDGYIVLLFF